MNAAWTACAAMMTALAVPASAADCPPAPRAQAAYQGVAESLVFNGLPMRIARFDSKQTPEQLLAFFRREWSTQGEPPPQEYPVGDWRVISTARASCFYTVQVRPGGQGTIGMVAVSELSQSQTARVAKAVPMLPGSSVVNDIDHRDPGKSGRTVMLVNGFSPQENAEFYRRRLGDEGWRTMSDVQMKLPRGPGIAMVMKRDLAELSVVITRQAEKTAVVANFMDNP